MVIDATNLIQGETLILAISSADIATAIPMDYTKGVLTHTLTRTFPTLSKILWAEWRQSTRLVLGFDGDSLKSFVYTLDDQTNLANFVFDRSGRWIPDVTEAVLRPELTSCRFDRFIIYHGKHDYETSNCLDFLVRHRQHSDEGDPPESYRVFNGNLVSGSQVK